MSLAPGQKLGVRGVLAVIGRGGMGEVYRARDTKLDRDVALKVLQGAFTADPDRLARFEREAKVLASLTIPAAAAFTGWRSPRASRRWSSSWSKARPRRVDRAPDDRSRQPETGRVAGAWGGSR